MVCVPMLLPVNQKARHETIRRRIHYELINENIPNIRIINIFNAYFPQKQPSFGIFS